MFNSINSKSNDNNFNNNYGFCSIDKCLIGKLIDNIEIIDPGNEFDDEEFEFIFQKNGYSLINPLFNIDNILQGINNKIKGTLISGIIDGDGNGYGAKSHISHPLQ